MCLFPGQSLLGCISEKKLVFFNVKQRARLVCLFAAWPKLKNLRKSTQPECISSQANVLWLFYLPKYLSTCSLDLCGR